MEEVLAHPLASPDELAGSAGDQEWMIRFITAVHLRTPHFVRRRLGHDGIWLVQAAARRALVRDGVGWEEE